MIEVTSTITKIKKTLKNSQMKKNLIFAIFFMSYFFTINAQTQRELEIGLAMPLEHFADFDHGLPIFGGSGAAATGFYLGYKQLSPLRTDGLYWTFNAGIMYNDLQNDFKDNFEDEGAGENIRLPKYLNVPVLAGLKYENLFSGGFKIYGEAGIGFNILKLTEFSGSGEEGDAKITFQPSVKLGYKVGVGIELQEKYTISLNYLRLGSHKVKFEVKGVDESEIEDDDLQFWEALSVSALNISFGLRF